MQVQKNSKKNNKIGILTFHFSHNCGAVLQAFALEKTVKRYADCSIIDYQPDYHASWSDYRYKYEYPPNAIKRIWDNNRNKIKAVISIIIHLPKILSDKTYRKDKNRTRTFENFTSQNMICSIKCKTLAEVEAVTYSFDVLITGSDQVWNRQIYNGNIDPVYFLKLNNPRLKKVSYAASAGEGWYNGGIDEIIQGIADFSMISVRENDLNNELRKNDIDSICTVDPTLLLKKKDYVELEKPITIDKPFIFIYAFTITEELISVLEQLNDKMDVEFISISFKGQLSKQCGIKIREIEPLGPGEFLFLIHNAEYVVTGSFHGTVFSAIYHKQFVYVKPEGAGIRIENFLEKYGLQSHRYSMNRTILFDEDFVNFDSLIVDDQKRSMNFIREAIDNDSI